MQASSNTIDGSTADSVKNADPQDEENRDVKKRKLDFDEKAKERDWLLARIKELEQSVGTLEASLQDANKKTEEVESKLLVSEKLLHARTEELNRALSSAVTESSASKDKVSDAAFDSTAFDSTALRHEGDFKFDKVFPPATTQPVVFEEIADLVTSALYGYKVCIFAYGQTGSGKTFTMFGDTTDETLRGAIPRSMQQIFQVIRQKSNTGWNYTVEASFLEIHNESIRDLLKGYHNDDEATSSKPEKGSVARSKPEKGSVTSSKPEKGSVAAKKGGGGFLFTPSFTRRMELLQWSVARTDMNEESSRSHAVFTLRLNGRHRVSD
ncbi:unnamed protein product [Closterium sp. Yama58-4]|nr:unnamed protein product [Closterium sp. Yama58-4]